MKKFVHIILLCTLVGIVSCSDRIDISTKDSPPCLVIYGYVVRPAEAITVELSTSTGFFDTVPPAGVSGAQVSVSDGYQTFALAESQSQKGTYSSQKRVQGIPGRTYTLDVRMTYLGVPLHYTASSVMPREATIEKAVLEQSTDDKNFYRLLLYAALPQTGKNYYSVQVWRRGVSMSDVFPVFDDGNFVTHRLDGVPCYYFNQKEEKQHLYPGDKINAQLNVITKEYSEFLTAIGDEVGGSIPFFSGPPANVPCNVYCEGDNGGIRVAGFFFAYTESGASVEL